MLTLNKISSNPNLVNHLNNIMSTHRNSTQVVLISSKGTRQSHWISHANTQLHPEVLIKIIMQDIIAAYKKKLDHPIMHEYLPQDIAAVEISRGDIRKTYNVDFERLLQAIR